MCCGVFKSRVSAAASSTEPLLWRPGRSERHSAWRSGPLRFSPTPTRHKVPHLSPRWNLCTSSCCALETEEQELRSRSAVVSRGVDRNWNRCGGASRRNSNRNGARNLKYIRLRVLASAKPIILRKTRDPSSQLLIGPWQQLPCDAVQYGCVIPAILLCVAYLSISEAAGVDMTMWVTWRSSSFRHVPLLPVSSRRCPAAPRIFHCSRVLGVGQTAAEGKVQTWAIFQEATPGMPAGMKAHHLK